MGLNLKITRKNGDQTLVVVDPMTEVEFEEEFDIALGEASRQKHYYWMAWKAEYERDHEDGKVVKLYRDWLKDLAEIEVIPSENPTKGRGRSSSPPSR